ncbi:MAG: S8 family serine peptidase [Xanthomonadales bacterium]|nr:S8 family serine peptidase [Xanthomonadales bacterium]
MKSLYLKQMFAIILGTSMFLPVAQAGDLMQKKQVNSRPIAKGQISAPQHSLSGEVEVFVRLDIPSVAELNIDSMKRTGKMADKNSQKRQAGKVTAQQKKMLKSLSKYGAQEQSSLRVGANGIRIKVDAASLANIRAIPGVRSVSPVTRHELDNAQSVPWIGSQEFWDTIGTGEGISVGIIDTGIDYQHMNFGGDGTDSFPTAKVVGGYDFVGDDYDGSNTPVPDADPLDCNGHGSHVAGSAAGVGVPGGVPDVIGPGVAKGADLYALRVFGCGGYTTLTALAIEWAMDPDGDGDMSDHLDVINMSLGSAWGTPDDPSAIATNNAAEVGIIVATSAGNSGDVPYITGAPGVASKAISTAASTKGGDVPGIDVFGDINATYEATEGTSPVRVSDGPFSGPLVQDINNTLGCTPFSVDMTDGVALISRGVCGFADKVANAEAVGAIAVVVYNDGADPSRVAPIIMGGLEGASVAAVMIASTDGSSLSAALAGGDSASALLDDSIIAQTQFFDLIAGFSSRGPGHGGSTFKPDVTNPGVSIVSTAAGTVDGSANFQGTSMASPHTAGVAALMRQQHPNLDSAAIKAIIQNSTVDMNQPLPLTRQGVGRVSVTNAMSLGSYASPGGVSFGRLNPASHKRLKETVYVTNFSTKSRNFTATHVPNQTVPGVSVKCDSGVKVKSNSTKKFKISISLDPTMMPYDVPFYLTQTEVDGWCVLDDGDDTLRVGYMATVDPASRMKAVRNGAGLRVQNLGGQAVGFAEGFTLTGEDGLFLDGTNNSIDAVGFRSADPDFYFGFPVMEIAVASEQAWESPSNLEWDIYIDIDKDGVDDAVLVGADYSVLSSTGTAGDMVTAQFNLAGPGGFIDWFFASVDYNDRVAIMPFTTDLGGGFLTPSFNYTMVVFGRDGSVDIQVGTVDTANEIIPDAASLGLLGGDSANLGTTGPGGDMLWIFPNNEARAQAQTVNVK